MDRFLSDKLICPKHLLPMLKKKSKFTGFFWSCANWPNCDMIAKKYDGQYEFTDQALGTLRMKGHRMAEKIWGEWHSANKKAMYAWMKKHTETGHFSSMNKKQCQDTINKLFVKTFKVYE